MYEYILLNIDLVNMVSKVMANKTITNTALMCNVCTRKLVFLQSEEQCKLQLIVVNCIASTPLFPSDALETNA